MTRATVFAVGVGLLAACALVFKRMDGLEWIPWGVGAFYGTMATVAAAFIPEIFE